MNANNELLGETKMLETLRKSVAHALTLFCLIATPSTPGLFAAADFPAAIGVWQFEPIGRGIWDAASKESEQIQTKVIVTKRRRYGDFMDAKFRIVFSAVPKGKDYQMCVWHGPKEITGEDPACVSGTFTPGSDGEIQANFNAKQLVQGEWMQVTIKSTDGKIQKSARFTPFK